MELISFDSHDIYINPMIRFQNAISNTLISKHPRIRIKSEFISLFLCSLENNNHSNYPKYG